MSMASQLALKSNFGIRNTSRMSVGDTNHYLCRVSSFFRHRRTHFDICDRAAPTHTRGGSYDIRDRGAGSIRA